MSGTRASELWCPSCEEWTALVERGVCQWCDGPLERRRGGWTRERKSRLTDAQLRALHRAHVEQELSINALAKRIYERIGYKSHHSAAVCISDGWKRLGLPARDRIEATRLASTKHGMAPKHGPRPGYGTYKRRVLRGAEDRPRCKAVKRQPPGKGKPCDRPAMRDSEFCVSHDPRRQLEHQARLADARRRRAPRPMLPLEPFARWVDAERARLGSLGAVAERLGCSTSTVHNIARRRGSATGGGRKPRTEIGRATVERYLARVGLTVEDVYGAEARRAA